MDRYADGEDAAFGELYDLLQPRICAFLARSTRDQARAEEITHETFLKMHTARQHFARGASVTAWAFAIARRLFIDDVRHLKLQKADLAQRECDERDDQTPYRISSVNQIVRRLDVELAKLPDAERSAFVLARLDELSHEEAAAVLDKTVDAVKMCVFRANKALRVVLAEIEETPPAAAYAMASTRRKS